MDFASPAWPPIVSCPAEHASTRWAHGGASLVKQAEPGNPPRSLEGKAINRAAARGQTKPSHNASALSEPPVPSVPSTSSSGAITFAVLGLAHDSPVYAGIPFALATILAAVSAIWFGRRFFIAPYYTSAAREVKQLEKRKLRHAMATSVHWKTTALAKRKEEEEAKSKENVNKGDDEAPKSQAQLDEELDTQMPSVKKLYELLFDESEQRPTTYYGICDTPQGAALVDSVTKLLGSAVSHELRHCMVRTQMGRGELPILPWMGASEINAYKDGNKLQELAELIRTKILLNLEAAVVDLDLLEEAEAMLSGMARQREAGYRKIAALIYPTLPTYGLCIVCGVVKNLLDTYMFSAQIRLLDHIVQGTPGSSQLFVDQTVPFLIVRVFCEFLGIAAETLRTHSRLSFLRPLKGALFENAVTMDVEWYDRHSAGDLNRKMQQEAEGFAVMMYSVPAE
jgi:RNA polymerase-binding transcription factor DksA